MEIHNPNSTYITYIQNITPLTPLTQLYLESQEYFDSFRPLESLDFSGINNILNIIHAFSYIAIIAILEPLIYLTTLVSFAYFPILESLEHLKPYKPFAYLAPLAILALLTLITLLINASKEEADESDEEADDEEAESDEADDTQPVIQYIKEEALTEDDFTHSTIEECKIINREGEIVSDKKKYRGILVDIWKTMEKQTILSNTTFKFKNGNKRGVKNYNWCEGINMSFQDRDSNAALRELLYMVKVNDYTIDLLITLKTGETVRFNID